MSKIGSHDPFGHLKHKLWPKEGSGVKLPIWLPTTKSWESPWFPCVQVAYNIPLENSQRRLQLCFGPHLNCRFAWKVMGLQSRENHSYENFGTLTWECHLDVDLVERHKIYYKGEGDGFPQVRAMVSLVSSSLLVARPNTKNAPTMH
jgi:hypothetical protein